MHSSRSGKMVYNVREAAGKLGIPDSHCRRLLARGKIRSKKLGHDWVVLILGYKRKGKPNHKRGSNEKG